MVLSLQPDEGRLDMFEQIVISHEGKVLRDMKVAYFADVMKEAEEFFSLEKDSFRLAYFPFEKTNDKVTDWTDEIDFKGSLDGLAVQNWCPKDTDTLNEVFRANWVLKGETEEIALTVMLKANDPEAIEEAKAEAEEEEERSQAGPFTRDTPIEEIKTWLKYFMKVGGDATSEVKTNEYLASLDEEQDPMTWKGMIKSFNLMWVEVDEKHRDIKLKFYLDTALEYRM